MELKKIIVTGANGQLGQELKDISFQHKNSSFFFFTRSELDITNIEEVKNKVEEIQPDYIINCAAYTAVDKAETEVEVAFSINATGVKNLAAISKQHRIKLVHISTDYVFDGTSSEPYKEDASVNPQSVYGKSKLGGEVEAMNVNDEVIIIRTAWVYSAYGNNFVKTMLRLMSSKPEINVVADQYGSPTYAADLAAAIIQIIEKEKWLGGIYHYSNTGVISWFDFAQEIKKITGSSCIVNPITTDQYPTAAVRPKYSVLDKEKTKQIFQLNFVPWEKSLQACLAQLAPVNS